jgi:hypothetical protein
VLVFERFHELQGVGRRGRLDVNTTLERKTGWRREEGNRIVRTMAMLGLVKDILEVYSGDVYSLQHRSLASSLVRRSLNRKGNLPIGPR